jgi:hypothetical protein
MSDTGQDRPRAPASTSSTTSSTTRGGRARGSAASNRGGGGGGPSTTPSAPPTRLASIRQGPAMSLPRGGLSAVASGAGRATPVRERLSSLSSLSSSPHASASGFASAPRPVVKSEGDAALPSMFAPRVPVDRKPRLNPDGSIASPSVPSSTTAPPFATAAAAAAADRVKADASGRGRGERSGRGERDARGRGRGDFKGERDARGRDGRGRGERDARGRGRARDTIAFATDSTHHVGLAIKHTDEPTVEDEDNMATEPELTEPTTRPDLVVCKQYLPMDNVHCLDSYGTVVALTHSHAHSLMKARCVYHPPLFHFLMPHSQTI